MEIKSHLFEIIQFCFLHSIILFLYLSVLLEPNFLKKKNERVPGFLMHCHICLIWHSFNEQICVSILNFNIYIYDNY